MVEIIRSLVRPVVTVICAFDLSWMVVNRIPVNADNLPLFGILSAVILWWFKGRSDIHKNGG